MGILIYCIGFVIAYVLARYLEREASEDKEYTYYNVLVVIGLAAIWFIFLPFVLFAISIKEFPKPPKWL